MIRICIMSPTVLSRRCWFCTEVVWIITVNSNHNTICRILWQNQTSNSEVDIGCITGNANPTGSIVTASSTDSVNSILVPLIQQSKLCIRSCAPVITSVNLVKGFENQLVSIVVLELSGNLCPQRFNKCFGSGCLFFVTSSVTQCCLK